MSTNNSSFPGSFLGKCSINIFLVSNHLTVILGLVQSQVCFMEGMTPFSPPQGPQIYSQDPLELMQNPTKMITNRLCSSNSQVGKCICTFLTAL